MASNDQQFFLDVNSALEHLRDEQSPVLPSALMALSNATPRTVQSFARTWIALSPERRRRVALGMVELAEDSIQSYFDPLFRYMLDDEDAQVRVLALDGLWEDQDPTLIRPTIAMMRSDPSAPVRAAAASALGRFVYLAELEELPEEQGREVREALLAGIRNSEEDLEVRRRAVEAISFFGGEEVRGIIAAAYESDDPRMRVSAVFAMGRSADQYWRNTVLAELDSPDGQLRFEAARASGELELKKAVPRLIQLLEDPDREVQTAAVEALGQIGGEEASDALEDLLETGDEILAESVRDALEQIEFTEGTDLLLLDVDLDRAMVDEDEKDEAALGDDDLEEDEELDDDEEDDDDSSE